MKSYRGSLAGHLGGCLAGLLAAGATPTIAYAQTTPVPIYQDRDEPGRNPHQELQYGCSTTYCTLTFKKTPPGYRKVITNITCDQFVPNGASIAYVSLQSTASPQQMFIPILFTYAGPYNGGEGAIYIANLTTLAFFSAGEAPYITMIANKPLANAHCSVSGYYVKV